jgi:autotransporter passenger strand-loop-strand repeat protein
MGFGRQIISGGFAISTTISSGGYQYVSAAGTAMSTTISSGGTELVFSGGTASATIFEVGGTLDLTYLSYASGGSATVTSSGLLTVSVGGQSYTEQLAGPYATESFQLNTDTGGGTLITAETAPCFRRGTRLLTDRGEVAVEDLRIGDLIQTVVGGKAEPVIWIGHRDVACVRHPQPGKVWPVRIAAGALGEGRPHSDVFLSPDHAVYVGDVLIPVKYLINSGTIAQVPVAHVTYYHIELARHDVVLAQGLPAESYLDTGDRSDFANGGGLVALHPEFSARIWEGLGCAPLIITGPRLRAARALVAARQALVARAAGNQWGKARKERELPVQQRLRRRSIRSRSE